MHKCESRYSVKEERYIFQHNGYGAAIKQCVENADGYLWCSNDEYGTRVNFCPFCGYKAPRQVEMVEVDEPVALYIVRSGDGYVLGWVGWTFEMTNDPVLARRSVLFYAERVIRMLDLQGIDARLEEAPEAEVKAGA